VINYVSYNDIDDVVDCDLPDRTMADEEDCDDSGEIQLSASTLAALQEFYAEQSSVEHCLAVEQADRSQVVMPAEDWVRTPRC